MLPYDPVHPDAGTTNPEAAATPVPEKGESATDSPGVKVEVEEKFPRQEAGDSSGKASWNHGAHDVPEAFRAELKEVIEPCDRSCILCITEKRGRMTDTNSLSTTDLPVGSSPGPADNDNISTVKGAGYAGGSEDVIKTIEEILESLTDIVAKKLKSLRANRNQPDLEANFRNSLSIFTQCVSVANRNSTNYLAAPRYGLPMPLVYVWPAPSMNPEQYADMESKWRGPVEKYLIIFIHLKCD